jgi:CheY-like chemotaxis protein
MGNFTRKHFLIVDDRSDTTKFLKDHLEKEGAQVECEQTLANALDRLEKEQFDLALIDLNVPPIPEKLKPNISRLRMRGSTLNQGQTLGVWLDDNKPNTKYAYLTSFPIAFDYRGDVPKQKSIEILDKSNRDDCIKKVNELLNSDNTEN